MSTALHATSGAAARVIPTGKGKGQRDSEIQHLGNQQSPIRWTRSSLLHSSAFGCKETVVQGAELFGVSYAGHNFLRQHVAELGSVGSHGSGAGEGTL